MSNKYFDSIGRKYAEEWLARREHTVQVLERYANIASKVWQESLSEFMSDNPPETFDRVVYRKGKIIDAFLKEDKR